jgi:hypothetical protein
MGSAVHPQIKAEKELTDKPQFHSNPIGRTMGSRNPDSQRATTSSSVGIVT